MKAYYNIIIANTYIVLTSVYYYSLTTTHFQANIIRFITNFHCCYISYYYLIMQHNSISDSVQISILIFCSMYQSYSIVLRSVYLFNAINSVATTSWYLSFSRFLSVLPWLQFKRTFRHMKWIQKRYWVMVDEQHTSFSFIRHGSGGLTPHLSKRSCGSTLHVERYYIKNCNMSVVQQ